ncbi:MAG: Rrf2 family transcriptional regulator [Lachnospiraceae bacterium]|nr:Rrf2 family transcriptional regulator [Lachnospiraceae bacterium]
MRINTRFTVAVHVMALTAFLQNKGVPAASELLAKSVGTNPVVIRQMMSMLKKAGLIETRNGVPGIEVIRPQEEITLLDIYKAVQKDADAPLFDFHPNPNPACFVGANIADAMEKPLQDAQKAMESSLAQYSLKDVTSFIGKKTKEEKMMLNKVELYYFSPTGGTKKVGKAFADALAKETKQIDLGSKAVLSEKPDSEVVVAAAPVFGGRIPSFISEKLRHLDGAGKKAVTLVVYGNRAYEDALLELNDVLIERGFEVIASGAFVAQHSMAPEVGAGRPDEKDKEEIAGFAGMVLDKLEKNPEGEVHVPGNRPYKQWAGMPAAPISLPSCTLCGKCAASCPTDAIQLGDDKVQTDVEKCMLCMGCTHVCPEQARILPPPLQEKLGQMLGALKAVHSKNEWFL